MVVISSLFILVTDRRIRSLQHRRHLDHLTLTWADMLYKICTYNVFRGNLPIVGTRIYIDSIIAPRHSSGTFSNHFQSGMNTIHKLVNTNEYLDEMFSLAMNNNIHHQNTNHSRLRPASVHNIHSQKVRK